MRHIDERAAEETIASRWGRGLINRRLNLVHDANYLIADHVDGVGAPELIAEAERIQAPVGLSHRRVNVDDQEAAVRLGEDFEARGYMAERFVIMARRRRPDLAIDRGGVGEAPWESIRRARRLQREQEAWATPALLDQLLSRHELTATIVPTHYFAAMVDGEVVSSCELRIEDETAQIETVETIEGYRNRGLARAVIGAALEAAAAANFVFLVTDADDWPQKLYSRLGFEPVGTESRFLHLLDA